MGKYLSKPMTHGRLKEALLSLGFRRYISPSQYDEELGFTLPEAVVYKHDEAGAVVIIPVFTSGAKLRWIHQDAAASAVHRFGVLPSKEEFNALITEPAQPKPAPKSATPKRQRAEATAA